MRPQKSPLASLPFGLLCIFIGAGAAYAGYREIGEFSVPVWVMYPLGAFFACAGLLLLVIGLLGHFLPATLAEQQDTSKNQFIIRALFIPMLASLDIMLWGMCWDNPAYGIFDRLLLAALAVIFSAALILLVVDTLRRLLRR